MTEQVIQSEITAYEELITPEVLDVLGNFQWEILDASLQKKDLLTIIPPANLLIAYLTYTKPQDEFSITTKSFQFNYLPLSIKEDRFIAIFTNANHPNKQNYKIEQMQDALRISQLTSNNTEIIGSDITIDFPFFTQP